MGIAGMEIPRGQPHKERQKLRRRNRAEEIAQKKSRRRNRAEEIAQKSKITGANALSSNHEPGDLSMKLG
jgi:hypothetical protein